MRRSLHDEAGLFEGGLREVGAGAWAWIQPNGGWGEANAGLVVGDGASALVDTLWSQRLARELLAATAPHTAQAPIRLAVNTHSDGDHWWGNAELPADAQIVTSRASLDAMREEDSPAQLARLRGLGRLAARLPETLPGGVGGLGRYVAAMLGPFAFGEIELRLPDRAFAGEQVERVGGRAEIAALRDYWRWLGDAVAAHHRAGRDPFTAARAMVREAEFARWRGWLLPERIVANVATVHRRLSGGGPLTAAGRPRLFAQMAQLARELRSG